MPTAASRSKKKRYPFLQFVQDDGRRRKSRTRQFPASYAAVGKRCTEGEQRGLLCLGTMQSFQSGMQRLCIRHRRPQLHIPNRGRTVFDAPELLLGQPCRLQGGGHGEPHHITKRTHIILRHPLPQLHLCRSKQRRIAHQPPGRLRGKPRRPVVQTPYDTHIALPGAEPHFDAHTRTYPGGPLPYPESKGPPRHRNHYVGIHIHGTKT